MILVVGSTGLLGGEICRRLSKRGESVRALTRKTSDGAKVQQLKSLGVEVVQGDLKDRASLDAACRGASTVISTATTTLSRQPDDSIEGVDQDGQLKLVDAARQAGVAQFIYVSYSGNIEVDCPLHTAKRTVERHLRDSGVTYTILRPSMFMEVWLSPALGFDFSKGTARLFGAGQQPISWISFGDVAEFAVRCVGHPAARNAVIELGGPEALSPNEVVRTFEEVTGHPFETQHVPETELEAQWRGAADPLQKSFAALMLGCAHGDSIDMRQTLKVFPLRELTVREYATRVTAG
jgi:NADH dehydrogenase